MACMGHIRSSFSKIKTQAQRGIDQTKAINDCLLCRTRQKDIEEHHKDAKELLKTFKEVNKCQSCRETLKAIIACAKIGHVYVAD